MRGLAFKPLIRKRVLVFSFEIEGYSASITRAFFGLVSDKHLSRKVRSS